MKIHSIALTMINGVGSILARQLLETFGDAETVFQEKQRILEKVPGIGPILASEIKRPEVLFKAEKELEFIEKNKISCYPLDSPDYPKRLKECPDAPLLLYGKGNLDLNVCHTISIVGTRRVSDYGRKLTEELINGLVTQFPDVQIISGLAYGVDICAHRNALKHGLSTIGVLAHGLDRIYPAVHRNTAIEMLEKGGLITDFPSGTNPDRANFLKRNRIIAGLSEATIVVESAEKGGSLVTADIAVSYSREVFTFPGRTYDTNSKGCHDLIRNNKAGLITSAEDLIEALDWNKSYQNKNSEAKQIELFFQPTPEQNLIIQALSQEKNMHFQLK